ncbi:MAG: F0F1 ATP synthase subunit B [Thermoleophilaceae bacterium]|nr:F0F1 ATP synthase subunit B [Thermoleophilaceae bacterium]
MSALSETGTTLLLAAAKKDEGGSFLVTPGLGLMLWTLIAFGVTYYVLSKVAFPKIAEALDKRRKAIDESIDSALKTKAEADQLLEEYRARLKEAREQADDIVARSRKAAEAHQDEAKSSAKQYREELMQSTRKDIENETRRALEEIRKEVAGLTLIATEKVTRKSLDDEDHRRLIEEALSEVDFSALAGDKKNGAPNGSGDS